MKVKMAKRYSSRNRYDSLPTFEEEIEPDLEMSEDSELEAAGGVVPPSTTRTVGAQERYRKLLERGPEKPSWGRILASGAIEFADSLKSRPTDSRVKEQMHEAILGRTKYRDELARAEAEAGIEQSQQAQQERERHQKTVEQNSEAAANAANATRRDMAEERAESLKHRAQLEQETNLSRQGYTRLEDGQPIPNGYETFKTEDGRTFVRPPKGEREGHQALPSYMVEWIRKNKPDLSSQVPTGPVAQNIYKQWENFYNQEQSAARNTADNEAMFKRQSKADQTRMALQEQMQQRAESRQQSKLSGAYQSELAKASRNYHLADRDLLTRWRNRYAKDENGRVRTPEQVEGMIWNDKAFLADRQRNMDELVNRKNLLAQQYSPGDVYYRMDPKTGQEVRGQMPGNVQQEMATESSSPSIGGSSAAAPVDDGMPPADVVAKAQVGKWIWNPEHTKAWAKQADGTLKRVQ
jgi:hypothetical protein